MSLPGHGPSGSGRGAGREAATPAGEGVRELNARNRLAHVRVTGDAEVVDLVAELLRGVLNVAEESANYPNRHDPGVRRYLTVLLPRAAGTRLDRRAEG